MTLLESKTISNLRFPLMCGVVLIHSVVIDPVVAHSQGFYLSSILIQLFSFILSKPCVPLFFFFSGFLFFAKYKDRYSFSDYKSQLLKRFNSIIVPYFFWNFVVLSYYAIAHKYLPNLINPGNNNVYLYSGMEWIRSFWDYPGNQPICYQFWFLRDLIVMMICSPLIYILALVGRQWIAVVLLLLWIFLPSHFPYQVSFTFFTLGAVFAIYEWNFVHLSLRYKKYFIPLFFIALIINTLNLYKGGVFVMLQIFLGSIVYIALASVVSLKNSKLHAFFVSSSFFIYAFHGFPVEILKKLFMTLFHPTNDIVWLLVYVCSFTSIMALCLSLFSILQRFFPKFTAFCTGSR